MYEKMLIIAFVSNCADIYSNKQITYKNAKTEIGLLLSYLEAPSSYKWMVSAKIYRNDEYREKLLCEFFSNYPHFKARIDKFIFEKQHIKGKLT